MRRTSHAIAIGLLVVASAALPAGEHPAGPADDGAGVVIRPLALAAPDAALLAALDEPLRSPRRDDIQRLLSWKWPGAVVFDARWHLPEKRLMRTVEPGTSRRAFLDQLAAETGTAWRARGALIEFCAARTRSQLSAGLAGDGQARGFADLVTWFAAASGLQLKVWPEVHADPPDGLWSLPAERHPAEQWLAGIAQAMALTIDIGPSYAVHPEAGDGTSDIVLVRKRPAGPAIFADDLRPCIRINPPPPALMDAEVTLDFDDTPLAEALAALSRVTGVPMRLVGTAPAKTVTLKVRDMRAWQVAAFVARLTEARFSEQAGVLVWAVPAP